MNIPEDTIFDIVIFILMAIYIIAFTFEMRRAEFRLDLKNWLSFKDPFGFIFWRKIFIF